jgi:hypothetical protein
MNTARIRADKRIPVTVNVWKALHKLRKPGQTYNDLLEDMIPQYELRAVRDYGDVIIIEPTENTGVK